MQVIQGLRELGGEEDPGLVVEIIDMFLHDAPSRVREIENALKIGDINTLERAAHTLKSSSANVGAVQLSHICQKLETLAHNKLLDEIPSLVSSSKKTLGDVAAVLRSIQ
jgi:HPt (histidine-containing phosphotransfer) domain-containing protein